MLRQGQKILGLALAILAISTNLLFLNTARVARSYIYAYYCTSRERSIIDSGSIETTNSSCQKSRNQPLTREQWLERRQTLPTPSSLYLYGLVPACSISAAISLCVRWQLHVGVLQWPRYALPGKAKLISFHTA
jgi:hypothetical protein